MKLVSYQLALTAKQSDQEYRNKDNHPPPFTRRRFNAYVLDAWAVNVRIIVQDVSQRVRFPRHTV
jgi:hypothetical protein